MSTVIKVENLGKIYRLGSIGTGTISHDLNRWWARVRRKEDPFLKLGTENDRAQASASNLVWALKDINFKVGEGEVLGIIGRNGAGKSTLLKILSRTTTPSVGEFKIKGRLASLLEVGTGFHPELTGRENIFLNGAILGMTKREIRSKFDEIVDFSGVERYIDTPVKRYSSGMYVRLAFAVAAHLDPEILIVDEVLAVGDAEFQKKCLGKMKDVSGKGKTVLFVSHNMGAIKQLCSRAIVLSKGRLLMDGSTDKVINNYLAENYTALPVVEYKPEEAPGNEHFRIRKIQVLNDGISTTDVDVSKKTRIKIFYTNYTKDMRYQFSIHLVDNHDNLVLCSLNAPSASLAEDIYYSARYMPGDYSTEVVIPANFLNETTYHFNIIVSHNNFQQNEVFLEKALTINGYDLGDMKKDHTQDWGGIVRVKLEWNTEKVA